MFTSYRQLVRKSGKKGIDRFDFLQELVKEFYQSSSLDSQEQVLANLANFAYDPLNYGHLRELKVIDLFVNGLQSRNSYTIQYSLKGLCNCANDPLNQQIIYERGGILYLKELVQSNDPMLVKNSLTTLIYMFSTFCTELIEPEFTAVVNALYQSTDDPYIKNLIQIFFEEKSSF